VEKKLATDDKFYVLVQLLQPGKEELIGYSLNQTWQPLLGFIKKKA